MTPFILTIALLTPGGDPVDTVDHYISKATCERARKEAIAAVMKKPNGYILVRATCTPAPKKNIK